MTLALDTDWSDESLDLRSLVVLGLPLFEWEGPPDYVLTDIIFLCGFVFVECKSEQCKKC